MGVVSVAMGSPEDSEEWASGSFLSDLNKAGSAISCLEIVLFIWIPTSTKLLTTIVDLWWKLGRVYGFFVTIIGITYMCLIIRNALCFVPYRRQEVEKNRDRAAIVYESDIGSSRTLR
jgi:ABC-type transport system involved in Fe-S cluster assembly fused permease/ATPase subunit